MTNQNPPGVENKPQLTVDEPTIQDLLARLNSWEPFARRDAVLEVIRSGLTDDRLTAKLKLLMETDKTNLVRLVARQALTGEKPPIPHQDPQQAARARKILQFAGGFSGVLVVNLVIMTIWLFLLAGAAGSASWGAITWVTGAAIGVLNLGLLIVLAFKWRWVAFGMLFAVAIAFTGVTVLGVFIWVVCSNYSLNGL